MQTIILAGLLSLVLQQSTHKFIPMEQLPDEPWVEDSLYLESVHPVDSELWQDSAFVRYTALMYRALEGDTTVDFGRMRYWFTRTVVYDPYGMKERSHVREYTDSMNRAQLLSEWHKARDYAVQIMVWEMCDIDAHLTAFLANLQLADTSEAAFHQWITLSLIESIKRTGDGKSPETAYEVISIKEERPLLYSRGYSFEDQALIYVGDKSYDRITAVNHELADSIEVWFDVTIPITSLDSMEKDLQEKGIKKLKKVLEEAQKTAK